MAQQLLSLLQVGENELYKLNSIPAETILEATKTIPGIAFGAVRDGITIPKDTEKAFCEGYAKDIPILIGTNADEWRFFTNFNADWKKVNENNLMEIFEESFGPLWPEISQDLLGEGQLSKDFYTRYDDVPRIYISGYIFK